MLRFSPERIGLFALTLLCLYCAAFGCAAKAPPNKPKYLGCFQDNKGSRDLPSEVSGTGGEMSKEVCEKRCRDAGKKYFALQSGEECWCGDSYGRYGQVDEGVCGRNCKGKPEQICGGVVVNSVYEIVY